jgi:MSHA pilin protein MshD
MTMIELVVAIVILGVGISGMMLAFSTVAGGSTNPIVVRQMQAIADEMGAEIALKPFVPVTNAANSGCARVNFNDVQDYNGYTTTNQICTIDGVAIPALNGYSVAVEVINQNWDVIPAVESLRIKITVSNSGQTLVAYRRRTGYAQ